MGFEVSAWLKVAVVKFQVQVMGLKIIHDEHSGYRAGEFAETVENLLGHQRDTGFEVFTMNLRAAAN
jgi:hypothetical protein